MASPFSTVKFPAAMSLSAGTTVGRYQIQSLLGSGGMGEVYKALDATLGRPVALKVLRRELSVDPERLGRFLHEARAASALNHPNILTIHEVGDHDASRFLVSEFVEGETLRQRLERGSLTLREILDIGIQTASALAAAHAASIVHRDIKPDNLMLRPDGYIKVLDFGVATFARPAAGSTDAMVTMAAAVETSPGMIVGTIAYMSPEQARGLSVDGRSDCYSLGVVLYELVTGRAPFAAPTTSDLLVAILEREPPSLRVAARALPAPLEWIIEKALEKDPNLRYQTIADLRVDLQRLKAALESGRLTNPVPVTGGVAVDAPLERDLAEDSPEIVSVSRLTWISAGLGAVAIVTLTAAMSYYHQARPGADLPLQLPYGAVVTKARDAIASFGYPNTGSQTDIEFQTALDVHDVTAMAGLAAAREAIREGAVAEWRVGVADSGSPNADSQEPPPGSFSVRLSPRGQIAGFATGTAPDSVIPPPIARADGPGARYVAENVRHRRLCLRIRAHPALVSGRHGRNDLAQPDAALRARRTAARQPAGRARRARRADLAAAARLHHAEVIDRQPRHADGRPRGHRRNVRRRLGVRVVRPVQDAQLGCVDQALAAGDLHARSRTGGAHDDRIRRPAKRARHRRHVHPARGYGAARPERRHPVDWPAESARLWAAEQLIRGKLLVRGVSASLVDGVSGGVIIAAVGVLADWGALMLPGFVPSISREIGAVEAGIGSTIGETLGDEFIALGIALAVETLDRARLQADLHADRRRRRRPRGRSEPAGDSAGADAHRRHEHRRRTRGLAVSVPRLPLRLDRGHRRRARHDAMAARSLEDPTLLQLSNGVLTIVFVLAIAGGWGLFKSRVRTPQPAQPAM